MGWRLCDFPTFDERRYQIKGNDNSIIRIWILILGKTQQNEDWMNMYSWFS